MIQETLRAASVLSFTFREAVKDVEFEGYLIPKGWKVLPLFRRIHHSPEFFPDPENFDPSRFEVYIYSYKLNLSKRIRLSTTYICACMVDKVIETWSDDFKLIFCTWLRFTYNFFFLRSKILLSLSIFLEFLHIKKIN